MGMKDQFKEKSEQLQQRARQHGQPERGRPERPQERGRPERPQRDEESGPMRERREDEERFDQDYDR